MNFHDFSSHFQWIMILKVILTKSNFLLIQTYRAHQSSKKKKLFHAWKSQKSLIMVFHDHGKPIKACIPTKAKWQNFSVKFCIILWSNTPDIMLNILETNQNSPQNSCTASVVLACTSKFMLLIFTSWRPELSASSKLRSLRLPMKLHGTLSWWNSLGKRI